MKARTTDFLITPAVAQTDLVDARNVNDSESCLNDAGTWARGATMAQLKHQSEALKRAIIVEDACPLLGSVSKIQYICIIEISPGFNGAGGCDVAGVDNVDNKDWRESSHDI